MNAIEDLEQALCKSLRTELQHFIWLQEHESDVDRLLIQQQRVDKLIRQLEDVDAMKRQVA
jgi:hypothetical protein